MRRAYAPAGALALALLLWGCPPPTPPTLSSDATIVDLSVNSSQVAAKDEVYTASVANDVDAATISLTLPSGATATIDGVDGVTKSLANLPVGKVEVRLVVTAEDKVTKKSYVLEIRRAYPGKVVQGSPSSGATNVAANPVFTWEACEGASYYRVCVEDTVTHAVFYAYGTGSCGLMYGDKLTALKVYAWSVLPYDADHVALPAGKSVTRTFTCGDVPAPPQGVTATADADGRPVIAWSASEFALSYEVYRNAETAPFRTLTGLSCVDPAPEAATAPGKENSYTVKAVNGFGSSAASSPALITIGDGGYVDITIN